MRVNSCSLWQVYVKGELIGGLDIVKELKAAGELTATLQGSEANWLILFYIKLVFKFIIYRTGMFFG